MGVEKNRCINSQYDAVDVVKLISCILVVAIHVKPFGAEESALNFLFQNYISRCAVPIFFMFTGYFLFNDSSTQDRIRRQLLKLIKLYIIWSFIYAPFQINGLLQYTNNIFTLIRLYLKDFFLTGSFYHLWYIPAKIFGIFLIYELLRFLNIRAIAGIAIVLYMIGLLGQSWYGLIEVLHISFVQNTIEIILKICKTTRNGLFEGFPFLVMGMLINRIKLKTDKEKNLMLLGSVISFVLLGVEVYLLEYMQFIREYDYYLMMIPLIFCIGCYVANIQIHIGCSGIVLRNMSTLVYLLHILVYELSKDLLEKIGLEDTQFLIVLAVAMLASYSIVFLAARLKPIEVLYTGSFEFKRGVPK